MTFASRTFWLIVARQESMKRFAGEIGFAIERKQEKLRDALNLIHTVGTRRAAVEWLRIYTKKGNRWVKCPGQRQLGSPYPQIQKVHGPVV